MTTLRYLLLAAAGLVLAAGGSDPVRAQGVTTQIVRDGSIGAGVSLQPGLNASRVVEIGEQYGVRSGTNLFHSFSLFNLGAGDTARFTANPLPTSNVISRVTGGASSINGRISSSIPGANLFFLNPAGLFFGPGATLDVRGSFHASTADFLRMRGQDGSAFFAFSPESLLKSAVPTAFGFLSASPAAIKLDRSQLRVPDGYDISLSGGGLDLSAARLTARGGGIGLASVASSGEVTANENGLDTASFPRLGDIAMTGGARLETSDFFDGAGSVSIRGGRFVLDNSRIAADVWDGSGGLIDIQVRGELTLSNGAQIRSLTQGDGNAADIHVKAGTVEILDTSRILSYTFATGNASNITIDADQSILLSNHLNGGAFSTGVASDVSLGAKGSAGDITVSAPSLKLDNAVISSESIGGGSAFPTAGLPGNIRIQTNDLDMRQEALIVNDSNTVNSNPNQPSRGIFIRPLDASQPSAIRLTGEGTSIQSSAALSTLGGAGITLQATEVSLSGAATIATNVFGGTANAGKIDITAERVSLQGGSQILSDSQIHFGALLAGNPQAIPLGSGGDITIRATKSVELDSPEGLNRTRISTTTFGQGNGGNISLTVQNENRTGTLLVRGAAIDSNNLSPLNGVTAGHVKVQADIVRVEQGGIITSEAGEATPASSSAGQVSISARESLTVQGSTPSSVSSISSSTIGAASAGDVTVSSKRVVVADGASIDSFTAGKGDGGNVRIGRTAETPVDTDDLVMQRGGRIMASSFFSGSGDAGSVAVDVKRLIIEDGGFIRADTLRGSDGAGGSITIRASESIVLSGVDPADPEQAARIAASTNGRGDAGRILVETPDLTIQNGARIQAASNAPGPDAGAAGSVFIGSAAAPVNRLRLSNGEITAFAVQGPRQGETREGNITVTGGGLVLMEKGASITSSVNNGLGGNITIGGPNQFVMRGGSKVLATTDIGTGGRIEIGGQVFFATADSRVSADAGVGDAGVVTIEAPQVNIQGGLVPPATSFLNASALLSPRCEVRPTGQQASRFVVAQRRGLPLSPEGLLQAFDVPLLATSVQPALAPSASVVQVAQRSLSEGAAAFRGGRFEEAGQRWAEAQAMYAKIGDTGARNDALRGLAHSQQAMGLHAQSVDTLGQALALARETGDLARVAVTLDALGNSYLALGQPGAAEERLNEGLAIAAQLDNDPLRIGLLNNLGNLHAARGAYARAVEAYEQSAGLASRGGDSLNAAKALANAARVAIQGGEMERGVALLERGYTLTGSLPATYDRIHLGIHIAGSYRQAATLSPAFRERGLLAAYAALKAAVAAARENGDDRDLSYALGNLSELYQSEYRSEEALYLVRQALRAAERADASELLYRWHWKEGQILWAQGQAAGAIESYVRAVEILEQTRQEALSRYEAAEVYFRRAVAPVYMDLVTALVESSAMVTEAAVSQQLLRDAREIVERLKAAELRDYFRDECVADLAGRTVSPETVAPRTAVVYPILLPDRLELLVTLPRGLRRFTVREAQETIATEADSFRAALQNPNSDEYLARARRLYGWLVEPYARELREDWVETLVFVPSGPLGNIPMAALHDGSNFLIQSFALAVTPGLALVAPRPLGGARANVLLAGLSESVQGQEPLPAVEIEMQALRNLYGTEPLLNAGFTAQRLAQQLTQGRPSIVHIASHAQFTGDPESSFILTYDGRVSMDALSAMVGVARFRRDPLELLVLSACETAAGNDRAALGLAGVALRAGARSALGSLWQINDEGTAELIERFYKALQDPARSRAEALREAQRALLQNPRLRHPFFWSPFLIIGNWL